MIVDKIENAHFYANLSDRIAQALEILKDAKLAEKDDGRYEVDGDNLYYLVGRYTTKSIKEGKLEAHKKYIDLQYVLSGRELLGYHPLDNLDIEEPYNEDGDCVLYKVPDNISTVKLSEGMFCLLFPQDAHLPGCQLNGPSNVHKVVVKVRIDAN